MHVQQGSFICHSSSVDGLYADLLLLRLAVVSCLFPARKLHVWSTCADTRAAASSEQVGCQQAASAAVNTLHLPRHLLLSMQRWQRTAEGAVLDFVDFIRRLPVPLLPRLLDELMRAAVASTTACC